MAVTTSDISNALALPLICPEVELPYVVTDSRQISFPERTLFVAIRTSRRDGHHYIGQAYEKGVRYFLVESTEKQEQFPDAVFFRVPGSVDALQKIATFHRNRFHLPVIGITGSNGKTIVKEWLFQILSPDVSVCRSPRSYNSQIGVPLSVWQLSRQHALALFEAGISTTGEMQKLQSIICPTIGIFTTLGAAHDEGFASREEKIREKWLLFSSCQKVICHTDDDAIRKQADESGLPVISWGHHPDCTYRIVSRVTSNKQQTIVKLLHQNKTLDFDIPFTDEASVENVLHVVVACLELQVQAEVIRDRISVLHALHMRLEWKKGVYNSLLLNDSYSYDLTSLEIALNHLHQQAGLNKMIALLSDLPGSDVKSDYAMVARLLKEKNIRLLLAVGQQMHRYKYLFEEQGIAMQVFDSTNDLISLLDRRLISNATLLVKGARSFGFEKIVHEFQFQQHETVLEISLSALANNLNVYRGLIKPGTKIMVMLKAFGYGSTDAELGRWLEHRGADYLAVAYTDEGIALREGGVTIPIMVMNPEPGSFRQITTHRLEPEMYCFDILDAFEEYLSDTGLTQYPVHLKIDTGMHRLGFQQQDLTALAGRLQQSNAMKVVSVFTHLVASENPDHDDFTRNQAQVFRTFTDVLSNTLPYPFIRHAANTAGIARHPDLHFDMVRLGIGLFGVSNTQHHHVKLLPVSRLFTTVAQVKKVVAGASVGYGRHAVLQRDSLIATVRIGYADGYRRQLGNGKGNMFIHGNRAPVAGNVCMDMTMLDITDLPQIEPGDRVEVFGDNISIGEMAAWCNTIPYEVMTGISRRVKRVLVEE